MKDRGKAVEETNNGNCFTTESYYSSSDLPCKKHPSSSSVGICAYCLKDRLVKLVCSDCGEQRLSSCSCSEISAASNNSCTTTVEVGSVGRISFLIENEKSDNQTPLYPNSKLIKSQDEKSDHKFNIFLKRSSSTHVEIKRSNSGFWKIGRLFRKRKEKGSERASSVVGGFDQKSDLWVFDYMGVSRSRSLCSFRGGGGGVIGSDLDMSSVNSAARSSSVTTGGLFMESGKRSGFSEAEARKSGFNDGGDQKKVEVLDYSSENKGPTTKRVFKLKESDFSGMDGSGFIDLKLELSSESKPDHLSTVKMSDFSASDLDSAFNGDYGGSFRSLVGDGVFSNGGSCRISLNERGIKKSRKSLKVWRWIFRHHHHHHHHPDCRSGRNKDEDYVLKS